MSLRLQRISRPPYLDVATLAAHLQTSRALEVNRGNTPTAHLPSSRSPYLLEATRFNCKAPELHTLTSPYLHACSPSPYLLEATHLQHASGAPELLRQTPLCPYADSAPLELHHHLLHSHHLYKHIKQELDHWQERAGSRAGTGERANFSPLPLRLAMREMFKG